MVHKKDARSDALEKLGAEIAVGDLLEIDTIRAAMEGVDAAYFRLAGPARASSMQSSISPRPRRKRAVPTIVNLSQRSANRESTSHSCRDSYHRRTGFQLVGPPRHSPPADLFPRVAALPLAVALPASGHPPHAGRQGAAFANRCGQPRTRDSCDPDGRPSRISAKPSLCPALSKWTVSKWRPNFPKRSDARSSFRICRSTEYCASLEAMGVPAYIVQHLSGAMEDYPNDRNVRC